MGVDLVVIGLGYVGMPLAREAARAGLSVIGYDLSQAVVDGLNSGRSHVDDVSDDDISAMLARGFRAVSDEAGLPAPDTAVICVPTPLSAADGPDLAAVCSAATTAARLIHPGMLVVLESTTYPGTTDEVVRPILEEHSGLAAGTGFHLAFSPERIDPGNKTYGIRNTPKIVGGHTPACADAAGAFYGKLCDHVVHARSTREAEMAKLLENTYRGAPPRSRSVSRPSTQAPESAATASRSTPTTCRTRSVPSATRSGSSNSPKRSTAGCPVTSWTGRPNCSTGKPRR